MADNKLTLLAHLEQLALRCSKAITEKIAELAAVTTNALTELEETKQDKLSFDSQPISGSTNPVTSGGVYSAIGDINTILDTINGEEI